MKSNKLVLLFVAGACSFPSFTSGAEPDFFINFKECKSIVAPLKLVDKPLNIVDGDPSVFMCSKKNGKILCQLSFEDGKQGRKGNVGEYKVTLDAPPFLHFELSEGNEYISVNTAEHTAVMSSLVLDKSYAGSKVCHGLYLTFFEYQNLKKQEG